MAGRIPRIFISSTFYDLRQVRADLFDFIETQMSYRALASEYPSFPVDPDADTVENCRRRVQSDADCMVLIIGGRYGSIPEDLDKSVTNIEYQIARAKGIPTYTFVQRDILVVMRTWESNPEADFSQTVDSTALFEFVKDIRSSARQWTFPFDTAQDIIKTLRQQFAYLMMSGLELQRRLHNQKDDFWGLSGEALRIALEQPKGWQGKLFAQCLIDEVESRRELKRAYESGVALGTGDNVDSSDMNTWIQVRLSEVLRLFSAVKKTVNDFLNKAFTSDDVSTIIYGARQAGGIYEEAIVWAQRVRRARVPDYFEHMTEELALCTGQLIRQTEQFGRDLIERIEQVILSENEEKRVHLTFRIDVENIKLLQAKFDEAIQNYKLYC